MSIPRVNFKVLQNNPIIDFYKTNQEISMFRMVNETDEFKLQKNTGSGLQDIMTVNEDGVVIFQKNVEFKGNSTIINTNVVTFQDQQVDLGLMSTVKLDVTLTVGTPNTSTVSKSNPSANVYRYTFKLQDSNLQIPFAVDDYILIQNIFSTATPPVPLFNSVALKVVNVTNNPSSGNPRTFTVETSLNYDVLDITTSDNAIASELIPITENTNLGIRLLGYNSESLVEGSLKFNNSSSNLSLENNTGAILVGDNSVNQNINIGTGGVRHIQVGSANAASVNLDANVFTIEGNGASNITTSSGILTVGGAGGIGINSNSGVINVGNESASGAINIGTAGARNIQVGNSATLNLNLDANVFSIDGYNASNINTSSGILTVGGAGGVGINSSSGVINVGNNADTGAINIGTAGARNIQVGNSATLNLNLDANVFSIDGYNASNINTSSGALTIGGAGGVGINSTSGAINLGNESATGAINIGTLGARTIQVGHNSASAINLYASGASNLSTSSGILTVGGAGGVGINSSSGVINVGNNADTGAINVGTAGARNIQIGNSASLNVNLDAVAFSIDGYNASNINTSSGILTVGGAGGVVINSSSGVINVGNESATGAINIGTAGARTIQVGSVNAAYVNLDANVFTIEGNAASNITTSSGVLTVGGAGGIGINSTSGVINVGNESATGAINIGTLGARTIQLGHNSASAINLYASGASNLSTSSGILTVGGAGGVGINSNNGVINVGNESATGAINIGTAGARNIQIGNSASLNVNLDAVAFSIDGYNASNINTSSGILTVGGAGGVAINSSSGVINVGNNADTGAINIGTLGARTIQVGHNSASAFNIYAGGASNLSTNNGLLTLKGGSGVTVNSNGGTLTLNGTGQTVDLDANLLDISSTEIRMNSTGKIQINSSAGEINIGNNAVNLNINIGTAGSRTVQVGSSTARVNLDAGSNGINMNANGPSHFTTSTGLLTVSGGSGVTVDSTGGTFTLNATNRTVDIDATTVTIDATSGGISLEASAGVINIGNNAVGQNINIGQQGARNIQVGSNDALSLNLDAKTFSIDGYNASNINTSSGILTVGGAGGVVINSNGGVINVGNESATGAINIGTAGARTIQVGSVNAAYVNLDANVFTIEGNAASNITTSSGVLTVGGTGGVVINSTSGEINIGNESVTGAINIGTSNTARTITIGSTTTTSVTAYNFSVASDLMLKTNVTPLSSTLDKVLQLEGYKYNWKDSENHSTQIGLIAQEVEQHFPELVIQNNNFKSVNYLGMIAVLINAMKEQQLEIENIRNKLN